MAMNQNLNHRKAQCKLYVTDKAGNPVKNQILSLRQTKHEFLFGSGAFDMIPYTNNPSEEELPFLKDRADKWLDLFNFGTLPFYWGRYEPEEGHPLEESRMNAAKFLQEKGVVVKGHPLCWQTACADWLLKYDNDTIFKKQIERIHRDVTAFKGTIDMWDVINEVVIMPDFDKYDNAITRICKDKGRIRLVKDVFAATKEANPGAICLLNDFNTSVSYEILIEGCLEAGVPIDVIGIQSHQHQGYWGAEKTYRVLKRFERFGLPIHFTENTLVSGEIMPAHIDDLNDFVVNEWPSTPEGEERQAKEWEEMYRILFDHPLVQAVTGWDFSDGCWLNAPSGIIRKDNSLKPSYLKLRELIKGEWWTDTEIHTDENGYVMAEGFKGDYEVILGENKAALKLCDAQKEAKLVL